MESDRVSRGEPGEMRAAARTKEGERFCGDDTPLLSLASSPLTAPLPLAPAAAAAAATAPKLNMLSTPAGWTLRAEMFGDDGGVVRRTVRSSDGDEGAACAEAATLRLLLLLIALLLLLKPKDEEEKGAVDCWSDLRSKNDVSFCDFFGSIYKKKEHE